MIGSFFDGDATSIYPISMIVTHAGFYCNLTSELLVAALFVAAATSGATFQVAEAERRYFLLQKAGSGSGAILTGSGG